MPAEPPRVVHGAAEIVDPAPRPHGGQPQLVLTRDTDRAVQLVRDRGDRFDGAANRHLRHGHRVVGLRTAEAVVGCGGDRQRRCRAGTFDLARHRGQRMLNGLECAQRSAELLAFAGVGDGEVRRGVHRTDHLHAAGPRPAEHKLIADGRVQPRRRIRRKVERQRSARFARQVVAVDQPRIVDHRDVKRVSGARGQQHGRRARPRHICRGPADPAADGIRIGHRDGEWPLVRYVDARLPGEPGREQIRLGDRHRARVAGQAGQHDRGLRGTGVPAAGQPAQPGLLDSAPQRVVELLRQAAVPETGVERSTADVVDELRQFVHRAPMPLATTPRSTSLVPPRNVKRGECSLPVASRPRSG